MCMCVCGGGVCVGRKTIPPGATPKKLFSDSLTACVRKREARSDFAQFSVSPKAVCTGILTSPCHPKATPFHCLVNCNRGFNVPPHLRRGWAEPTRRGTAVRKSHYREVRQKPTAYFSHVTLDSTSTGRKSHFTPISRWREPWFGQGRRAGGASTNATHGTAALNWSACFYLRTLSKRARSARARGL